LCGGFELWLGSAMPSWRMAGWLWRMAEASRESLQWERRGYGEKRKELLSLADWCFFFPLRLRSSGALIAEINERDWGERGRDSENDPTISFSFCELLIARTARVVEDVHVFLWMRIKFSFWDRICMEVHDRGRELSNCCVDVFDSLWIIKESRRTVKSSECWAWKVISGCELDLQNVDVRVRISGCMSRLFSLDPFFWLQ
jgi:hypothetical protein